MMANKSYVLMLTLIFVSGCHFTEDPAKDASPWEYALPSEFGMDEELLDLLDYRIRLGVFDNVRGVMAVKGDKMIFENYYGGSARGEMFELSNATISVLSLLVGIAIDKGAIADVMDPISKYYTNEVAIFNQDVLRRQIKVYDLLQMKSGISWNESATSLINPENDLNKMMASTDWVRYVLNADMEALPGLRYAYNSAHGLLLVDLIQRASGMPFEEFARIHLFSPLGIEQWEWARDPSGNINGGFGLSMSLMDFAKIGYLMASQGVWKDKRIVSTEWIQTSTRPKFQINRFNDFSLSWWNFSNLSSLASVLRQNDAYYAEGLYGQYLFVVPHAELVVAVISENYVTNPTGPIVMLRNYFLPALPNRNN